MSPYNPFLREAFLFSNSCIFSPKIKINCKIVFKIEPGRKAASVMEMLFAVTIAGSFIRIPKLARGHPDVEQSSIKRDTSFVDFVFRDLRSQGANAIVQEHLQYNSAL